MIDKPVSTGEEIPVKSITVERAAEILNKTEHSVRQLINRGKLKKISIGRRIFVDYEDLSKYYANKRGLPSWEENYEAVKDESFIALDGAAQALMVQPPYAMRLIRDGFIKGYVTMTGDCLVSRESINAYLRMPNNDADSL
jgi:excisionase family DNA binding protein